MKLFKGLALMGALCLVASSALHATDDEISRILAKYGLDKKTTTIKKAPTQTSLSGDLANQLKPDSKAPKVELQKTAQTGKKLQDQLDKSGLQQLEKEINTQEDKKELENITNDVKKVEREPKTAADTAPGFFSSLLNFPKLWYRVNNFNKVAAANIKRFSTTFNNVGIALASLDEGYKEGEHYIIMPKKDRNGAYATGANKLIQWEEVPAKEVTNAMIERLKLECQYIIIKEMVDGFKHLQPVIEPVLEAFSYLAPKLASQSRLIYEVGSQFLPMLETLAKDNLSTVLERNK